MGRRTKRDAENMNLEQFMNSVEFTSPVESVKRDNRWVSVPKNLLLFVVCSAVLGALAVVPFVMVGAVGVTAAVPFVQYWKEIPSELPDVAISQRNIIYDKNGAVIASTWSENRIALKNTDQIGSTAINALIDTEDKRFWTHSGFDVIGTARSAISGSGGGSGITQQLVKNLLYYNLLGKTKKTAAVERSLERKMRELKLAIQYDKEHSKNEILVNYFNTVAFGAPNIYGIETASQYFFGVHANKLTLAQASALVGTAQNPVLYNMNEPKKLAKWKTRQAEVLGRMVAEGHVSKRAADVAKNTKLKLLKKSTAGGCSASTYPFYCSYVLETLLSSPRMGETKDDREALLAKGGLQIHTYMDPSAMKTIDDYMSKNWGDKNRIVAPTAIVQPGTGAVIAFGANRARGAGGTKKGETEINLAASPAATGSAYKPFTLSAALNSGMTENQLAFSSEGCPLHPGPGYDAPPNGFKNSNSCALQGGYLNYKQATAYSSNTWYVTLEKRIGVDKVKEFSASVGLSAPDSISNRSLSYALGAVGNSPINVAAAYATFANKGVFCPATPISSITYDDGSSPAVPDTFDPNSVACRSVMSPQSAGIVLKSLRANVSGEVPKAFGIRSNLKGFDNGGKSGTNEGFNSAWAQVSGYYALFTDVYDMDKTVRGVDGAVFKGSSTSAHQNTAQSTGGELFALLHAGKKNVKLDFDDSDNTKIDTAPDLTSFLTVPSVIGMEPAQALSVLNGLGLTAHVSKKTAVPGPGYPSGVVIAQSVNPGERLVKGTKKEVILTISS